MGINILPQGADNQIRPSIVVKVTGCNVVAKIVQYGALNDSRSDIFNRKST
jgi:hypothetical protein